MKGRSRKYVLLIRVQDKWLPFTEIDAPSRREAFRIAMTKLKPEDYKKEIRIQLKPHRRKADQPE